MQEEEQLVGKNGILEQYSTVSDELFQFSKP